MRHAVVSQGSWIDVEATAGLELDNRQRALICRGYGGGRGATASRQLLEEGDDTIRLHDYETQVPDFI